MTSFDGTRLALRAWGATRTFPWLSSCTRRPLTHPDAVADHIARWVHGLQSRLGPSGRT